MASTYVNDLRLNELATGDGAGTWGTTTNTNLELIAEAFSFGTEAITTNADTHTTTIADGATDPGRSLYLKYTGTLDSACTITIGPNTVSKLWFIENGTSGSQNIIISQGSGANVTIPAGDVKAVYSDGAGSGAAMVDAFASLSVVDLKVQDDLTVTDDMTVGGTLGVTGVLTATSLDISGDIDVDGTTNLDVVDIDGAVDMASTLTVGSTINGLTLAAGSLSGPTSQNMAINTPNSFRVNIDSNNDGSSEVFVVGHGQTGVDNSSNVLFGITEAGVANLNAKLTITTADNLDTLSLVSTDADANVAPNLRMYRNSGSPADSDQLGKIQYEGRNDNSQDVIYAEIGSQIKDASDGTEDGRIFINSMVAGTLQSRINILEGETVFNEESIDLDFRVESNGNTHAIFVDGGNDEIGLFTSAPNGLLHIGDSNAEGDTTNPALQIGGSSTYRLGMYTSTEGAVIENKNGDDGIQFKVKTAGEAMRIDGGTGNVGIGTSSPSSKLQIIGGTSGIDQIHLATNLTDNTNKFAGIIMTMFTNNTAALLGAKAENGNTSLFYGSSGTDHRGVTKHIWYTNTNYNATSGNTERMRMDSKGNLIIGTTSSNPVNIADHRLVVELNSSTSGIAVGADGLVDTRAVMTFYNDNGTAGTITTNASSTAYNTSSDYRLKENVDYTWDATTRLKQLKPARFNFIADADTTVDGFLAHEVSSVVPEAITGEKDGTEMQGIDQSKLVPLLVKTIQELEARITALES